MKVAARLVLLGSVAWAVLGGLLAAPAGAAPSWLTPVELSPQASGIFQFGAQIAVDPQGNVAALWSRFGEGQSVIQSAERPAGGAWTAPVDLTALGQTALTPQVAVDPQGDAVAAWRSSGGANYIVQSAVRPAGGVWQAPVDLSAEGEDAFEPQVSLDSQGNAVVVWERSNGSNVIVQAAVRPAGGVWQASVDLSAQSVSAFEPQVALGQQCRRTRQQQQRDAHDHDLSCANIYYH